MEIESRLDQLPMLPEQASVGPEYILGKVGNQWTKVPMNILDTVMRKSVLCVGGDHMYTQWWGSDGTNGMAKMYYDYGIRPYMAINTNDPGGEYPGASGRLSYSQISQLVNKYNVEPVNHGARHFQSWMRCTSGITVRYNGAGSHATLTINTSKLLTTSCTGAAGDNQSFDLTNASYNTLRKVVDAFNAVAGGKYQACLAPELTGSENSQNLAMITGAGIKGSVADNGYTQTAWAAGTPYNVGDVRKGLATDNGYYFVCTTAGTSGGAEPSWNKQIGATTTDNTATWTCCYAQAVMLSSSADSTIVPFKGWNFAASGGIVIQFNQTSGTARNTGMVTCQSNLLTLTEDGCQVAQFNLTNASYDTLTELVAAINAVTNWSAKLCDNTFYDAGTFGVGQAGPAYNNYCSGGELSRDLKVVTVADASSTWFRIETGLAGFYVTKRNIQKAHDMCAANGITLQAFAQSGGEFYPWLVAGQTLYKSYRGDPYTRSAINPMHCRLHSTQRFNGWYPHKDLNDSSPLSFATLQSYVDALCDDGPWLSYLLCHWLQVDGTSGYTLTPQPPGTGFGSSETIWKQFLAYVQTKVKAGLMVTATPSQLPYYTQIAASNGPMLFNSKLRNSGDALGSLSSDGKKVPGWLIRTSSTPTIAIANGVCTLTAIGSSQLPLTQDMQFVPGEIYEIGFYVDFDNTAITNGIRVHLIVRKGGSSAGMRYRRMDPGASNALVGPYINHSGFYRYRFAWPHRSEFTPNFIRSLNTEPYNLSVNTNIQVNYTNIGATADINCATGAASAAAVTAKEVANRINTVVAATAAYLTRAEYHNIARGENGRVVIESPFRGNPGSTFWMKVLSGSSADALATIFGTGSGLICQSEPVAAGFADIEDSTAFMQLDLNTTNGAVVSVSDMYCVPANYM